MARISARCDKGHAFRYQKLSDLLTNWTAEKRCEVCGTVVHWYGEWPPPKTAKATETEYFEVLKVILLDPNPSTERRLDEEGLGDDGYRPFLLITQTLVGRRGSPREPRKVQYWWRYFMRPDKTWRFGQDGPILFQEEVRSMTERADKFLEDYRR